MKTERKNNLKNLGLIVGGLTLSTFAVNAGTNAFEVNAIGSGGEIRSELTTLARNTVNNDFSSYLLEAKCGESKTKKGETGKAAEAKCGEKGKAAEAKCGEGKCGEGKCGEKGKASEAKCGEKGKATEAKCGEKGKSTEAKCGEKK